MAVGSTSAAESGADAGDSAAGVSGRAGCSINCGDVQADNTDVTIARVAANSKLVFRIFVVLPLAVPLQVCAFYFQRTKEIIRLATCLSERAMPGVSFSTGSANAISIGASSDLSLIDDILLMINRRPRSLMMLWRLAASTAVCSCFLISRRLETPAVCLCRARHAG
jgi:hypothetical protein